MRHFGGESDGVSLYYNDRRGIGGRLEGVIQATLGTGKKKDFQRQPRILDSWRQNARYVPQSTQQQQFLCFDSLQDLYRYSDWEDKADNVTKATRKRVTEKKSLSITRQNRFPSRLTNLYAVNTNPSKTISRFISMNRSKRKGIQITNISTYRISLHKDIEIFVRRLCVEQIISKASKSWILILYLI